MISGPSIDCDIEVIYSMQFCLNVEWRKLAAKTRDAKSFCMFALVYIISFFNLTPKQHFSCWLLSLRFVLLLALKLVLLRLYYYFFCLLTKGVVVGWLLFIFRYKQS